MSGSDLAGRVNAVLGVDREEFDARVADELDELKRAVDDGTFDNPQGMVGLEYEFYGVDGETDALKRVPRRLLEFIGFEKELGLHNAEMQTTPQPLSRYGLRAQETEVQARLDAALRETTNHGIHLVSDGMWTVPPIGETATQYLTDSVVEDGVRIATNMSDAVRYHAMANTEASVEMRIDAPHVTLEGDTVMPESLITSIQPHYQVSHAADLPTYFRYALRVAGPLLALGVNSPFFPPELYDDVDPHAILDDCYMENRVGVFEGIFAGAGDAAGGATLADGTDDPADAAKVRFPRDVDSVEAAIDRIAADRTVVPMLLDDTGRYDDAFRHFRHKHGTFWRWVRPVFDGATRSAANARIEFRPLPGQPAVRDAIAFQAVFAGLLESLPRREHPLDTLEWKRARDNFYEAVQHGLRGEFHWVSADGALTADPETVFDELFELAADGLSLRGLDEDEVARYVDPLRERFERRTTPARWKYELVRDAVDAGVPFGEAVWGMQAAYVEQQRDTLVEGSFTDWLD